MSHFPYIFFDDFIVRTPVFSCKEFQVSFTDKYISSELLFEIYKNDIFKEAIYLASPFLHQLLENWKDAGFPTSTKKDHKLRNTLLKYYNRMSTRCTPFGLFAGVGLGQFSKLDDVFVENRIQCKKVRDTKLDMHFLDSLCVKFNSNLDIKKLILFSPNNSIYKVGNRIRYIEYEKNEGKRDYIISTAPISEELEKVIIYSKEGKTICQLTSLLVNDEISSQEALQYIEELIEGQVLVSEIEPNVAGIDFFEQILSILDVIGAIREKDTLVSIKTIMKKADSKFGNHISIYSEIEKLIKSINMDYEAKYLFQTDVYFENKKKISYQWKKELKKGISFLNKITHFSKKDTHFEKFKQVFVDRFGSEEISLSFALDTEVGIGYRQDVQTIGIHPYIDNLTLPAAREKKDLTITLNTTQVILNQKIQTSSTECKYTIQLTDKDFSSFEEDWTDLADTMSFMAEIISENNQEKLYLNSGSGNAGRLLARFCSEKSNIKELVKKISQKERELSSDKILAEIIHLPESRIGNILRRPEMRQYEIPYLAKSLLPLQNQIALDDLYISIKNGDIILRSKRLNKEIIPLLTNAHNYSTNSLPIYHFLSVLGSQNIRDGLHFDWGGLTHIYNFLPRVEYENIILSKAQWQITAEEISALLLLQNNKGQFWKEVRSWRNKRQIPLWAQWVKQDNAVLVNFENEELLFMFLSSIKNENMVILEEFLYDEQDSFTHQFIFPIYKKHVK